MANFCKPRVVAFLFVLFLRCVRCRLIREEASILEGRPTVSDDAGKQTTYTFDVATEVVFAGDYSWHSSTEEVRDLVGLTEVFLKQKFAASYATSYASVVAQYVEPFVWEPNLGRLRFLFTTAVVYREVADVQMPTAEETLADLKAFMESNDYMSSAVQVAEPDTLFSFAIGASSSIMAQPTPNPTEAPSKIPSSPPSTFPSFWPSSYPSDAHSAEPSSIPSKSPSFVPSALPSMVPSNSPSHGPSDVPSTQPSLRPTAASNSPSMSSSAPTSSPAPSLAPSSSPSEIPASAIPPTSPSSSSNPSNRPSSPPSDSPSGAPSLPSNRPSELPSLSPFPTTSPTGSPKPSVSKMPTSTPSIAPSLSHQPSRFPSVSPSVSPIPTLSPAPSGRPSNSAMPTTSTSPSIGPSARPTRSGQPSSSEAPTSGAAAPPSVPLTTSAASADRSDGQRHLLVWGDLGDIAGNEQTQSGFSEREVRQLQTEMASCIVDVSSELEFEGNFTTVPTPESVDNLIRLTGIYLRQHFASRHAVSYYNIVEKQTEPFVWDEMLGKLRYFFEISVVFRYRDDAEMPTYANAMDILELAMNADVYLSRFVMSAEPDTLFPFAVGIASEVSTPGGFPTTAPSFSFDASSSVNTSSILIENSTAPSMRPSTSPGDDDIIWYWTPEQTWVDGADHLGN